ncbi:hypothetical protein KUG47_09860 [Falsochrobactrum sp. TDYN1]|uniref:Uncharacterized protein n=1 Tax=Falsochrobactrum tianjinense TaxID=2706015 RepID=A0A949UUH7_9HYPH|nr:hypothetical protein [Falsochrobactrum sp. TDYN1]MBV2143802.1 hypothetical protein [Falsochrobactrum sp. TDYN1]
MTQVKLIDATQVADALAYGAFIDELAKGFAAGCIWPERQHHMIENLS